MNVDLHNALLTFQLHRDRLERACGRHGAPIDLDAAREALPEVEAAIRALGELLKTDAPS